MPAGPATRFGPRQALLIELSADPVASAVRVPGAAPLRSRPLATERASAWRQLRCAGARGPAATVGSAMSAMEQGLAGAPRHAT
jgi:hypothetical protein